MVQSTSRPPTGSSPHTRGARLDRLRVEDAVRIIPAYAGSTVPEQPDECLLEGSSPHTRGAPPSGVAEMTASRIIPAYAGSTGTKTRTRSWPQDHPRIRGEHVPDVHGRHRRAGSSPHTRGAPFAPSLPLAARGIIPAYAGSTGLCNLGPEAKPDHPRIRGEHNPDPLAVSRCGGSSPHTRGARQLAGDRDKITRIIPAYAGSTLMPAIVFA